MNENIRFLQAFLKHPLKVGAVAPSSPELAAEMLQGMRPDENNILLELGVGTGAITKFLTGIIPNKESYLGIELDDALARSVSSKFGDLNIVSGSATDAYSIHKESGLGKVSYVVCCLPFVSLPREISECVLVEIDKFMEEGCTLRLFQYVHGYYLPSAVRFRDELRKRYGRTKRGPIVLKNIPPAYTLTWSTA